MGDYSVLPREVQMDSPVGLWRPHGPVMQYFREQVIDDYHSRSLANTFVETAEARRPDFAQQHPADQELDPEQKRSYTLVVAMRNWFFAAFRDLRSYNSAVNGAE